MMTIICTKYGYEGRRAEVDEQQEYGFVRTVTIPYLGGECVMWYSPLYWKRVEEGL